MVFILYFPEAVSAIQILQMTGSVAMMVKALSGDIIFSITMWWDDVIPVEVSRAFMAHAPAPPVQLTSSSHACIREI